MKQKLLLWVLTLGMFCLNSNAQNKELKKAKDGFEWYLVSQNGKYGATDAKGKSLIPIEYDTCAYHPMSTPEKEGFGCFKVTKGDYLGCYSVEGENVIPVSRKYKGFYKSCFGDIGPFFVISLQNGCFGTCDIKGNVVTILKKPGIVPCYPIFEHGLFYYWTNLYDDGPLRLGLADIHGNILAENKYCGFELDLETERFYGEDCDIIGKMYNICPTSKIDTHYNPFANDK